MNVLVLLFGLLFGGAGGGLLFYGLTNPDLMPYELQVVYVIISSIAFMLGLGLVISASIVAAWKDIKINYS